MNDPSAKRLVSPLSRRVNRGHGSRSCVWRKVALAASVTASLAASLALGLSASLFSPAALAAEAPLATGERHVLAANDCLPAPSGPVVLTVEGAVSCGNAGSLQAPRARFDLAMLEAMPSRVVATHTPWTQGRVSFSGPLLRELVARVSEDARGLKVRALNDFVAEIPLSDIEDFDVLLATRRDGERMPVRDLGPLFVLYPFDAHPELLNEQVRFRSVWQVTGLTLE